MIAVLLLGLALGLDSFRASLAMGASGLGGARAFRVALAFGACDGVAPLVGLALSRATVVYVASWSALIESSGDTILNFSELGLVSPELRPVMLLSTLIG